MLENEIIEYLKAIPYGQQVSKSAHDIAEICEVEDTYWKREFERVANNYEKIWIENAELKTEYYKQGHLTLDYNLN